MRREFQPWVVCTDNTDPSRPGRKICTLSKPLSVLPWSNNAIMKHKCCMVSPPGMMKTIYLFLLSLPYYTLRPLMTADNCVACLHLVKLLACTCEMVCWKSLWNRSQLLGELSSGNCADWVTILRNDYNFFSSVLLSNIFGGRCTVLNEVTSVDIVLFYIIFNEKDKKWPREIAECPSTDICENWVTPRQWSVTVFLGGEVGGEIYFNLFVFYFKFHALAIFSGLPEH